MSSNTPVVMSDDKDMTVASLVSMGRDKLVSFGAGIIARAGKVYASLALIVAVLRVIEATDALNDDEGKFAPNKARRDKASAIIAGGNAEGRAILSRIMDEAGLAVPKLTAKSSDARKIEAKEVDKLRNAYNVGVNRAYGEALAMVRADEAGKVLGKEVWTAVDERRAKQSQATIAARGNGDENTQRSAKVATDYTSDGKIQKDQAIVAPVIPINVKAVKSAKHAEWLDALIENVGQYVNAVLTADRDALFAIENVSDKLATLATQLSKASGSVSEMANAARDATQAAMDAKSAKVASQG